MISLINHDSSEGEQWGRYNLPRYIYIYITLIYPRGSNSEHKPGAQNEHQPNAENKGLIWWYDTDKFLYENQKKDQVDTMNM